jgi:hypothetical protein
MTNLCHENEAKLPDALASAQKTAGGAGRDGQLTVWRCSGEPANISDLGSNALFPWAPASPGKSSWERQAGR